MTDSKKCTRCARVYPRWCELDIYRKCKYCDEVVCKECIDTLTRESKFMTTCCKSSDSFTFKYTCHKCYELKGELNCGKCDRSLCVSCRYFCDKCQIAYCHGCKKSCTRCSVGCSRCCAKCTQCSDKYCDDCCKGKIMIICYGCEFRKHYAKKEHDAKDRYGAYKYDYEKQICGLSHDVYKLSLEFCTPLCADLIEVILLFL